MQILHDHFNVLLTLQPKMKFVGNATRMIVMVLAGLSKSNVIHHSKTNF
jgi:hypothetical protein